MIRYTEPEQIKIFNNCKTISQLLQAQSIMQDLHPIGFMAKIIFDINLEFLTTTA